MSRVKELNERLNELVQWHEQHEKQISEIGVWQGHLDTRIDQLLHLMQDMVRLEGKIEGMEEEIRGRLERMEAAQVDSGKLVDRLIEMSMVNKGQPDQAVIHRAQSRLENKFSDPQAWAGDEVEEDVWPPPGCDIMDVTG